MRIYIEGGDSFDLDLVNEVAENIKSANGWAVASVIVRDGTQPAALAARDWAVSAGIAVRENPAYLQENPDVALLFPGANHKTFRSLMAAGVPLYRITPEGRYTKYGN